MTFWLCLESLNIGVILIIALSNGKMEVYRCAKSNNINTLAAERFPDYKHKQIQ